MENIFLYRVRLELSCGKLQTVPRAKVEEWVKRVNAKSVVDGEIVGNR